MTTFKSFILQLEWCWVYVQHEKQYQLNKKCVRDSFIRLGFAGMSENKFADGVELLVESLMSQRL